MALSRDFWHGISAEIIANLGEDVQIGAADGPTLQADFRLAEIEQPFTTGLVSKARIALLASNQIPDDFAVGSMIIRGEQTYIVKSISDEDTGVTQVELRVG